MSDPTKDCEARFGTGNEPQMRCSALTEGMAGAHGEPARFPNDRKGAQGGFRQARLMGKWSLTLNLLRGCRDANQECGSATCAAFFAAGHDQIKADEIGAQQLRALREYLGLRDKKLRLTDIRKMFKQMRDHVWWMPSIASPMALACAAIGKCLQPPRERNRPPPRL